MKKVLLAFIPWLFAAFSYKAMAQEDVKIPDDRRDNKKEAQEIIIRKKGDKDATITINISGDKVTVNGKPLVEFKDDAITINKRNVIVRNGNNDMVPGYDMDGELGELNQKLESLSWANSDSKPYAFLGVTTEKADDGAKITEVTEESAAAKAGLQLGDVITKIGDAKIDGPESLSKAIRAQKPKTEVKVSYKRDGKEKSVKATLEERKDGGVFSFSGPDGTYKTFTVPSAPKMAYGNRLRNKELLEATPRAYNYNFNNDEGYNFSYTPRQKLGLKIQDTEDGNGVKVIEVQDSSAAAKAGIQKDDIITEVGGAKVTNTDDAREQLQENMEKSSYNIKAKRNGTEMSFDIKIPKRLKTANL